MCNYLVLVLVLVLVLIVFLHSTYVTGFELDMVTFMFIFTHRELRQSPLCFSSFSWRFRHQFLLPVYFEMGIVTLNSEVKNSGNHIFVL